MDSPINTYTNDYTRTDESVGKSKPSSRPRGKLIVLEGIDGSGKTVQTRILVERLLKERCRVQMTDFPQYGKSFFADMIERYLKGEFGWPQELRNHLKKHPLPKKGSYMSNQISTERSIKSIRKDQPDHRPNIVLADSQGIEPKPEEVNPYLSSLLYAGDRWEIKDHMNKWLDEGKVIISNRYVCSNMAHQGAKISSINERKKFFKWIEELEYKVYAIPKPDLIIYLHVPIEFSQELIMVNVKSAEGFKSEVDMHEKDVNYLKEVQKIYINRAEADSSWFTVECIGNNQILSKEEIAKKVWNIVNKMLSK